MLTIFKVWHKNTFMFVIEQGARSATGNSVQKQVSPLGRRGTQRSNPAKRRRAGQGWLNNPARWAGVKSCCWLWWRDDRLMGLTGEMVGRWCLQGKTENLEWTSRQTMSDHNSSIPDLINHYIILYNLLGLLYKMKIKKSVIVSLYLEGKKLILYLHKTRRKVMTVLRSHWKHVTTPNNHSNK